jgi:hypothetical protein
MCPPNVHLANKLLSCCLYIVLITYVLFKVIFWQPSQHHIDVGGAHILSAFWSSVALVGGLSSVNSYMHIIKRLRVHILRLHDGICLHNETRPARHLYRPTGLDDILYARGVCHTASRTRYIGLHISVAVNSVDHEGYEIGSWEDNLIFLDGAWLSSTRAVFQIQSCTGQVQRRVAWQIDLRSEFGFVAHGIRFYRLLQYPSLEKY